MKFNFKTIKCDADKTVIDDSRKIGKPMELVIGKKFKLAVWETIVQAMAVNEVASFTVDKSVNTLFMNLIIRLGTVQFIRMNIFPKLVPRYVALYKYLVIGYELIVGI